MGKTKRNVLGPFDHWKQPILEDSNSISLGWRDKGGVTIYGYPVEQEQFLRHSVGHRQPAHVDANMAFQDN